VTILSFIIISTFQYISCLPCYFQNHSFLPECYTTLLSIGIICIVVTHAHLADCKFLMESKMVVEHLWRLLIVRLLCYIWRGILRILMSILLATLTFVCIISSNQLMTNPHMRLIFFVAISTLLTIFLFNFLSLLFYLTINSFSA